MRSLKVTGIVVRPARYHSRELVRLEHVTGQPLFLLTSRTHNLRDLLGQVVRVSGLVLGQELGTEAPLFEVIEVTVLAPATMLAGGVYSFGPAILQTELPSGFVTAGQ